MFISHHRRNPEKLARKRDALCVWHVGGQFPHPSLFKRRRTLSYIYVHALGLGDENGEVAVNGRLGGQVSYLANSGFTQRRLHAAFDLATPIVPIFTVPEDYRVDSARRHVLFVNAARAKYTSPPKSTPPRSLSAAM